MLGSMPGFPEATFFDKIRRSWKDTDQTFTVVWLIAECGESPSETLGGAIDEDSCLTELQTRVTLAASIEQALASRKCTRWVMNRQRGARRIGLGLETGGRGPSLCHGLFLAPRVHNHVCIFLDYARLLLDQNQSLSTIASQSAFRSEKKVTVIRPTGWTSLPSLCNRRSLAALLLVIVSHIEMANWNLGENGFATGRIKVWSR